MNGTRRRRHSAVTRGVDAPRPQTCQSQRIVVCGGGIVGLTTCYFLAKQGHEVVCIEKEAHVGDGGMFHDPTLYSSWADLSLLYRKHMTTSKTKKNAKPFDVSAAAWLDPAFWAWGLKYMTSATARKAKDNARKCRDLCNYSERMLVEVLRKHPELEDHMDRAATGTLELFATAADKDDAWQADRIKQCVHEFQYPLHPVDTAEAAAIDPAILPTAMAGGALFSPLGTNGDVSRTCDAMVHLCRQAGVMFRLNTEIDDLLVVDNRIVAIQTKSHELIEGDSFVLALGNDTPNLATLVGVKLYMYPVKGYVLTVGRHDHFPPLRCNVYSSHHGGAVVSPLMDGSIRICGGAEFAGKSSKTKPMDPKRVAGLLHHAKAMFPTGYLDESKVDTHVCLRPVSADDVPMIGQTTVDNLFVNCGHGAKGWTQAFGAAALLADDISGKIPAINMDQYSPHRFGILR
ncbi:hypothetical protein DYB37_001474 [Aphanomyces astaci]|uniref:FAD dependent oxidoreductase domain-containing protein n=2 Tax=Aphanomyces astaci TaxID=112090 RepID=A0A3R6WX26_APHAT|nr:hypothetical protein DYB35_004579 [Aphanomyces astaci]RHZ29935.1 hypothetical protein DYB37_001474 [Aphanomyces astaci]